MQAVGSSGKFHFAMVTGITLKDVSHQWIVTLGGLQVVFGKDTRMTDVVDKLPDAGFAKVPNCHPHKSLINMAKRCPYKTAMAAIIGRITGTWPPVARDTEWRTNQNGREVTKPLRFWDFSLNDGTGEVALSVEGEEWQARFRRLNAKTGDLLLVYDMKVAYEAPSGHAIGPKSTGAAGVDTPPRGSGHAAPDGGSIKVSPVKSRDPVMFVIKPEDTKRDFPATDGPVLTKARAGSEAVEKNG